MFVVLRLIQVSTFDVSILFQVLKFIEMFKTRLQFFSNFLTRSSSIHQIIGFLQYEVHLPLDHSEFIMIFKGHFCKLLLFFVIIIRSVFKI